MKKTILALAALGMFAGVASAQSSLKLSGSIDLGVARIGEDTKMQTAGTSARSGIAFSGTEDLGGGMSAEFYLNHRFNPQNGTENPGSNLVGNQFWRNSWVQVNSGFGSIRLGRYLAPLQEYNGGFDAFGTDTVGSVHTGGLTSSNVRINSAVEYRTPSFGGFSAMAMVADTNDQGNRGGTERPMGFGARYKAGPVDVAVAYDKTAADIKTVGLYGAYNWGGGAVMGQFERGDANAAQAVAFGTDRYKRYSISTKIPFGAIDFKAGYASWKEEETKKLGLGLDYNLSKRTQLYVDMGKLSGDGPSDTAKKTMWDVGVYHKF